MHEFLSAAFPWIIPGLALAVAMVYLNRAKK